MNLAEYHFKMSTNDSGSLVSDFTITYEAPTHIPFRGSGTGSYWFCAQLSGVDFPSEQALLCRVILDSFEDGVGSWEVKVLSPTDMKNRFNSYIRTGPLSTVMSIDEGYEDLMTSISFSDNLTVFEGSLFADKTNYSLKHITFPNTLKKIGVPFFRGLRGLSDDLIIPHNIEEYNSQLSDCQNLSSVIFTSATPPSFYRNRILSNCPNAIVRVPYEWRGFYRNLLNDPVASDSIIHLKSNDADFPNIEVTFLKYNQINQPQTQCINIPDGKLIYSDRKCDAVSFVNKSTRYRYNQHSVIIPDNINRINFYPHNKTDFSFIRDIYVTANEVNPVSEEFQDPSQITQALHFTDTVKIIHDTIKINSNVVQDHEHLSQCFIYLNKGLTESYLNLNYNDEPTDADNIIQVLYNGQLSDWMKVRCHTPLSTTRSNIDLLVKNAQDQWVYLRNRIDLRDVTQYQNANNLNKLYTSNCSLYITPHQITTMLNTPEFLQDTIISAIKCDNISISDFLYNFSQNTRQFFKENNGVDIYLNGSILDYSQETVIATNEYESDVLYGGLNGIKLENLFIATNKITENALVDCKNLKQVTIDVQNCSPTTTQFMPAFSAVADPIKCIVFGRKFNDGSYYYKLNILDYHFGSNLYNLPNTGNPDIDVETQIRFLNFNNNTDITYIDDRLKLNPHLNGCLEISNNIMNIHKDAFNSAAFTSIVIGADILDQCSDTTFGSYGNLRSLRLENNITNITNVFKTATVLDKIYYGGTVEQWNLITKATDWKLNIPSTCVVRCTDGDIPIANA